MRHTIRRLALASSLAAVVLPAALVTSAPVLAQGAGGGDQGAPQQVALTQKQIDGLLASATEMNAAQGQPQGDQPDSKAQAKMESIAKKHGFASLDEYGAASESLSIVLAGIDPETKKYIGPTGVINKQIAEVQADKSMPARDKAETLKQLKDSIAAGDGPKPPQGNIDLVVKNYDKLAAAFQGSGGTE